MRFIIVVFFSIFLYGANIDKKIDTTKKTLKQTKTQISKMNSRLVIIGKKIQKENRYISNINKKMISLNKKIYTLKRNISKKQKNLLTLEKQKAFLLDKKYKLEKQVVDFIANNYYIQTLNISNEKDLINEEVLKVITKESTKRMSKISNQYLDLDSKISDIAKEIEKINKLKNVLENRKKELEKLKIRKKDRIVQLKKIKIKYKKELEKIIKNQDQLQIQLSKLKIIKAEELRKRKLLSKRNKDRLMDKVKVKNYGNVYMKRKTITYRGLKTFPPVKGQVIRAFGSYVDPVYKISLYNDSITIKTKPNAKVRAIFSGIIVFVGETNEGKMIVIKHRHRLHSVYAKLKTISPFVKKGYHVKKGEIIARVNNELEFEITYKDLPINPMQVINF